MLASLGIPASDIVFSQDELKKLVEREHAKIDKETAATGKAQASSAKNSSAKTAKTTLTKSASGSTKKDTSVKSVTPGKSDSAAAKKGKDSPGSGKQKCNI